MQKTSILWADDEIDLLKPHILFLNEKGCEVTAVNNGNDAIEASSARYFDVVFLDEHMPGLSGLETLSQIKSNKPGLPVVMITKSEEETIMEEAIGAKIDDYLIKPVNPKQILSSIKKILDKKRLVNEKVNTDYQQEFRNIGMAFNEPLNHEQWAELYKKLVHWELEIENTVDKSMSDVLVMQKEEANINFSKFIIGNYLSWLNDPKSDKPVLSHRLFHQKVFPVLKDSIPVFLILLDNLRFDQWKSIEPLISDYFVVEKEETFYSILPTATQYSRNAIFSGLLPSEMSQRFPGLWVEDDDSDQGKNLHEEEFLKNQLLKNNLDIRFSYHKVNNVHVGKNISDNINNLLQNKLNVIVYNFIDRLSHAKTDVDMIKELASTESAYRSLTQTWFIHSPLMEIIKKLSQKSVRLIITTDHGTIMVKKPSRIIGDKSTNTNLRYKHGKNLNYETKEVFAIRKPSDAHLPQFNLSTSYVFTLEDYFFAYPNNYNYYVNYYKNTFQHGGVSIEEMIVPFILLKPKT